MTAEMTKNKAESRNQNLAVVLRDRISDEYGKGSIIEGLVRLSGGASRETWSAASVQLFDT